MPGSTVYLPDGQRFTVVPVFAGLLFRSNELSTHNNSYPVGWTIVLHSAKSGGNNSDSGENDSSTELHSFHRPTLQADSMFISSVSNPSTDDVKPAASLTRQLAMMLWVSLYWYFQQQPAPDAVLPASAASAPTPASGRPRGDWRIHIQREGMLKARNLLPKLERMGLVASPVPSAAAAAAADDNNSGWDHMFVTRSMFWQTPPQLFLFSPEIRPTSAGSIAGSIGTASPTNGSRPVSPTVAAGPGSVPGPSIPLGPFASTSHLPTYFPPSPLRYTMTGRVRHPARPRPPRMGEVFYSRFVPSVNQYLSLRVASLSPQPVAYTGPVGPQQPPQQQQQPPLADAARLTAMSDTALMQAWMAVPRVSAFWGHWTDNFLVDALASQHSFPVIAQWDGVPFGYLELYWVKEDTLGGLLGGAADDFDRGLHVFVGEEWARGRVPQWLSSVVQYLLTSDCRTMSVCIEPRVDNERFIRLLEANGFNKEREVTFPHKQSWFGRLKRDGWEGVAL